MYVSAVCEKKHTPWDEVPEFSGAHRVSLCCTLSGVVSHKASLILLQ